MKGTIKVSFRVNNHPQQKHCKMILQNLICGSESSLSKKPLWPFQQAAAFCIIWRNRCILPAMTFLGGNTMKRTLLLLLALLCMLPAAHAAGPETLYPIAYCFRETDFRADHALGPERHLRHVRARGDVATVCLGERVIRAGDVLPCPCWASWSFCRSAPAGRRPLCATAPSIYAQQGKCRNHAAFSTLKTIKQPL